MYKERPQKLTEQQVEDFRKELKALCKKKRLWNDILESNRPELKFIEFKILLKVG